MTPNDPLVGTVLDGRYEIQARVGEGGMGVVYRARQLSIDRVIALKMLSPQMATDPTWVQRFYNEAKACSRLQHPNTIRMFDFGQTQDGRLYMSMEFLDGVSLRQTLQTGPLAPQRVVKILIQCCASLAEAHAVGIIHRDIKPDNVFLLKMPGDPDFVKLLDFSVAKLLEGDRVKTQAGVVFGTPQYMSPEQARAMPLDARSDLYALGVLAFEMLSGMVPFHDDNPMTVIQMQMAAPVPPLPPATPFAVQQIALRALEKDAARRYQSASEMMQHCQQVFAELAGGGGMPRPAAASSQHRTVFGQESPFAPVPGTRPPDRQSDARPPQMVPTAPPAAPTAHVAAQPNPMMANVPDAAVAQAETIVATNNNYGHAAYGYPQGTPGGYAAAQQQMPQHQMPQHQMPQQQVAQQQMPPQQMMPPPPQQQQLQPQQPVAGYAYPQTYPVAQPGSYPQRAASETVPLASRHGAHAAPATESAKGASTLFWILSMLVGIGLGVLAYVIVLQVS
jgi:serine/threonine-protein kinase